MCRFSFDRTAFPEMTPPHAPIAEQTATAPLLPSAAGGTVLRLAAGFGGLALLFAWPLFDLARFSLKEELYSHLLLIPFISGYLIWQLRAELPAPGQPDRRLSAIPLLASATLLAVYWLGFGGRSGLEREDALAITTLAFLFSFYGVAAWLVDPRTLRALAFPLLFLLFLSPFPSAVREWIEIELQHASASASFWMFKLSGMPVFRQETFFELPGIRFNVAPECSGIRSTFALFITSLIAGHMFLRSPWKRTVLVAAVIPLAIVRNGFRVWVIGQLCVRYGSKMFDSFIHHQGGPIFFALSLIPFLALLWWLARPGRSSSPSSPATS